MGSLSIAPELSLDIRTPFVPNTINDLLKEVSGIRNVPERVLMLNDYVKRLEEEMKKIDAFKRALPLCMLLLNDAILILKEQSARYTTTNAQPVLEEFIPLKKERDENQSPNESDKENDSRDKKNWMSSVQLWNTDENSTADLTNDPKQNSKNETKMNEKGNDMEIENPFQSSRDKITLKPFMPFKGYSAFSAAEAKQEDKDEFAAHGLSLLTPGIKNPKEESGSGIFRSNSSRAVSSSSANVQSRTGQSQQQASRKQRRCWSPELHRRFLHALEQLGGSHVATPKQIRELMQVDGLTNDEVKSHLQKYRLHVRRLPSSSSSSANQSLVVLGGFLMPQDQYSESSKGNSSQSGSPQGPFQLSANGRGSPPSEDDDDV
ncbi:hypothetical protein UlMin_042866 [Ulmus minor]